MDELRKQILENLKKIDGYEEIIKENETNDKRISELLGMSVEDFEVELGYSDKRPLSFQKINTIAITPKYNYPTDSGFDLHSVIDIEIEPFQRVLVPTGLKFGIDDGYELQIRTKSGLAINQGLIVLNSPGTVDNGYTGEVKVILLNVDKNPIKITKGMKIAQAVLCPVVNGAWVDLNEVDNIEEKDRSSNGFGSTGLK